MTAREQAIDAAARAIWDEAGPECIDDDGADALAQVALAAAVPVLLNDLADRIEAETRQWKHTVSEDCWYTCPAATEERDGGECCNDAAGNECDCGRDSRAERLLAVVRAVAEGWGA